MKKLLVIVSFVLIFAASVLIGVASAEDADEVECVEVFLPETEDCPTMAKNPQEMSVGPIGVFFGKNNLTVWVQEGYKPSVTLEVMHYGESTLHVCNDIVSTVNERSGYFKVQGLSFENIEYLKLQVFYDFAIVHSGWYTLDMSGKTPSLIEIDEPAQKPTTEEPTTEAVRDKMYIEPYCNEGTITVNVHGGFYPEASIMVRYEWDEVLRDWEFAHTVGDEDFYSAYTEFGLCVEHLAEVQIHAWDGFGQNVIMKYTVVKDDGNLVLLEEEQGK